MTLKLADEQTPMGVLRLPKGTLIHVGGLPVTLAEPAMVMGAASTLQQLTPSKD